MYPLDGTPFVEYTMREIASSGMFKAGESEFLFVVGHHGEQVARYFGEDYAGARVRYVTQEVAAGTAHAVRAAVDTLTDDQQVIVWLGDAFFPSAAFDAIVANSCDVAVTIVEERNEPSLHHRVDFDEDQLVSTWQGTSPYVEAGLWKIVPDALSHIGRSPDGEYRMLYVLDEYIGRGNNVGYIETPRWIHLGGSAPVKDRELREAISAISS